MLRTLVLSMLLVACSAAEAHTTMTPVAAYLSSDSATEHAIATSFDRAGIAAIYVGSLGTTVNVDERDAPRARELLGELSAHGVAVTVIAGNEK